MQPRRPHGQRAPPRLITMWPISPAAWRPVQALPFRTRPPPTPVPQKTPRTDLYGLPAPSRNSAIVPTRTSWPRCTAVPISLPRVAPTSTGASQSEITLRALATVPASASTVPGDPTPTPSSADGSTPAALAAAVIASASARMTPFSPASLGVGMRCSPSTLERPSTTTAWIFVPPRSMPPRMCRTFLVVSAGTLLCRACRYWNVAICVRRSQAVSRRCAGSRSRSPTARSSGFSGRTLQEAGLAKYSTGREHLHLMSRLYGLSRAESRSRADELLELFELEDAVDRLVRTYSGGARCSRSRLGGAAHGAGVELDDLLGRDGAAEVEALAQHAAVLDEEAALGLGLDALGERLEAEVARELHDGRDEQGHAPVLGDGGHERAVDLERRHAHLREPLERRVAGAEVVDRDAHAALVQVGHHRLEAARPGDRGGLGDLDHEAVGGDAGRPDGGEHALDLGGAPHERRHVDRRIEVDADAAPLRDLGARRLDHPVRDRADHAGALCEWDEGVRADEAALAVVPPDQRLDADHPALVERHERLVMEHQLAAVERVAEARDGGKLVGGVDAREERGPLCEPLGLLGAVHRDVRLREQLLGALGVGRVEARADAGAGVELAR